MSTKPKRKLTLARETVAVMHSDELATVVGGITVPVSTSRPTHTTQVSLCLPDPPSISISNPK